MKYCVLLVGFILISCVGNRPHIDIVGSWGIEEIKYNDENYFPFLHSNLILFYDGGELSVPESNYYVKDDSASWELIKENNKINIECNDLIFKGEYDVRYVNASGINSNEIILVSKTTVITMFRFGVVK